ncbi:hypothetical protein BAX94_02190 [Elizabethkingia meningoseptica]|uniref:Uncharacterized protein n=2 Tax=Weeksellaceae TaxID=2762318 RepID=A0A1T3IYN3_ELIME|nr:hypothetical protein BBD35_08670 [Elizabethkingia meningoseptica]OHT32383.1 hypothetical protein BGC12_00540 [Elizabethkingia meningoseptica]OOH93746.1 hypothetical protein BMF97_15070 [Elizabethkingia meningoseptica]OPB77335.1 hypothetical protein BAY31_04765 [Elizabethkingia meningoseptica]OPC15976.1 hypothetical protein BAX94_02190 [Elizabethkingia meningoseptica]
MVLINAFNTNKTKKNNLKILSIVILLYCLLNEIILKPIFYPSLDGSLFYSMRMGLPFFAVLTFFIFGYNFDIKQTWRTICLAVAFSGVLSILSLYFYIPFLVSDDELMQLGTTGRIFNDNSNIGLIMFFILLYCKETWLFNGIINKIGVLMGCMLLILSFNRTMLFCVFLLFIFNLFSKKITYKKIINYFFIICLCGIVFIFLYNTFPAIKNQIDSRILYLFLDSIQSNDRLIESNRDFIYEGIQKAINDGYWVLGMPYSVPVFYNIFSNTYVNFTDISIINILLRFGIICLLLVVSLFKRMYQMLTRNGKVLLFLYFIASANIDLFFRHITVLFIFVFWLILTQYKIS